jgi:hypothetical protein
MPALNFQARFAGDVATGKKYTTIRKPGRIKPGNILYLYTGQRTKACRKLGEALCLGVTPFRVSADGVFWLNGCLMHEIEADFLARLDTVWLWNKDDLVAFFRKTYGLPFEGELIIW